VEVSFLEALVGGDGAANAERFGEFGGFLARIVEFHIGRYVAVFIMEINI
jgi:hypothetical protein|tara:strand:- start:2585 stop:2734 length:150 start_codon:yes stop_codon:yes gene_type:complete